MSNCPYRKIRPLGEGAVGDVHLCVDLYRRRLVVVKWLRAEVHEESEAAIRFHREAQLMSGTRYDGVIKVEHFDSDEFCRTWMAMEFVDGVSPGAAIGRGDTWATHRLLAGIGRGLDELHGLGVVHRDLKPDNILLRDDSRGWDPVIIDLGIAKWLAHDTATATGSVFGTPHYMSPEQFRDTKHVGPATDRYALAVIAFELLSGRLPFDGRSLPDLLAQHMEARVPPLQMPAPPKPGSAPDKSTTRPPVSTPRLDRFMATAMAKDPEARFASGADMARAFREAAKADGVWVEPQGAPVLFPRLARPLVELRQAGGLPQIFDLRQGPVVLGRHEACQAILSLPRMSRLHACLYRHGGRLWVADLHSQNGTHYDGRPVIPGSPVPLRTDANAGVIRLYDQELQLVALEPSNVAVERDVGLDSSLEQR